MQTRIRLIALKAHSALASIGNRFAAATRPLGMPAEQAALARQAVAQSSAHVQLRSNHSIASATLQSIAQLNPRRGAIAILIPACERLHKGDLRDALLLSLEHQSPAGPAERDPRAVVSAKIQSICVQVFLVLYPRLRSKSSLTADNKGL